MRGWFRPPHLRREMTWVLLLTFLTLLAGADGALAQGLRGKLADPVSQADLDYYERLLQFSTPQRQALRHAYREYLDQLQSLREGPVEEHLKAHPRDMTVYEVPDDPAVPRQAAAALRKLADDVRRLDEAFFDRLVPSLTESQAQLLSRIRAIRQRQRYRQGPAWVTQSPYLQVDLSLLIDDLDLTSDQQLAIAPVVRTYERNLLAALKDLDAAASNLRIEIAEQKIARAGEAADHGLWLDATVLRSLYANLTKLAGEIGSLHRRLCAELAPLIDQAALDELLDRYHALAYPEIAPGRGPADESLLAALERDDLSGDQHDELQACSDLFRLTAHRIKEDMLNVVDALRLSIASHPLQLTMYDGEYYEDKQTYIDRLDRLEAELTRANEDAMRNLAAILDEPLETPAVDSHALDAGELSPPLIITFVASGRAGPRTYRQMRIPLTQLLLQFGALIDDGPDRFKPAPICQDDVDRYASRLLLDDDDRLILAALHDAYLERYGVLEADGAIAMALKAQRAMLACGSDGKVQIPTISQVQALFDLRRSAVAQITELDAAFFDDIAVVWNDRLDPELVQRLRNARLRAIRGFPRPSHLADRVSNPALTFGENESREAWIPGERIDIDFAPLMNDIDCDPQARAAADAAIKAAEIEITDLMRQLLEARFEMERLRAIIMARHLQRSDDGMFETTSMVIPPAMEELDGRIDRLLMEIRAANRACFEQVVARLPAAARAALEGSYLRGGYPEVYHDGGALHDVLIAARNLKDLKAAEAAALDELSLAYRTEYERISRLITQAGRDQDARDRFNTERAEVNNRTSIRLHELLTAGQLETIRSPG